MKLKFEIDIPYNWFLYSLKDKRTRIVYSGDTHYHQAWSCELQHVKGGRLVQGVGLTPQEAAEKAILQIY